MPRQDPPRLQRRGSIRHILHARTRPRPPDAAAGPQAAGPAAPCATPDLAAAPGPRPQRRFDGQVLQASALTRREPWAGDLVRSCRASGPLHRLTRCRSRGNDGHAISGSRTSGTVCCRSNGAIRGRQPPRPLRCVDQQVLEQRPAAQQQVRQQRGRHPGLRDPISPAGGPGGPELPQLSGDVDHHHRSGLWRRGIGNRSAHPATVPGPWQSLRRLLAEARFSRDSPRSSHGRNCMRRR